MTRKKKRHPQYKKTTAFPSNTSVLNKKYSIITKKIDNFFNQHNAWLFVITLTIMLICVFHNFVFLQNIYMFAGIGSDTVTLFYPDLHYLSEYIRTEGIPKWSHAQGMGQNIFPFSIGAPFNLILILAGKKALPYLIGYIEIIKILISGIFFYLFLRTIPINKYGSFVGGLLYSFSGFIIIGSSWYVFSSEGYQISLLLYSFEKLYKNNFWYLFPLPIAIMAAFEPFNLYLYGLLLIAYMFLRILSEQSFQFKRIFFLSTKLLGLSILGLLISGVFLLPNLRLYINSPRVSGDVSLMSLLMDQPLFATLSLDKLGTLILRLFSNDILGNGSNFRGYNNYLEAPLVYCSIFSLVIFSQVFGFLSKKAKLVYGTFLGLTIITIIFPYFRYALWLFSGDYYRGFSFYLSLLLIFFTAKALDRFYKTPKINRTILAINILGLLCLLYYPYFPQKPFIVNHYLQTIILISILIYGIFLILLKRPSWTNIIKTTLPVVIAMELVCVNYITVNSRDTIKTEELKQKTGFNDYTVEAVDYLNSIDKSFFRIHKNYYSSPSTRYLSLNEAKIQGYYSTSSYDSFNQKYYVRFLGLMGIIRPQNEYDTRWCQGLKKQFSLLPWASSKYYLIKGDPPEMVKQNYEHLKNFENVQIYRDPNFVPLGFTYDKYIPLADFLNLSKLTKERAILTHFVCEKNADKFSMFKRAEMSDIPEGEYTYDMFTQDTKTLSKETLNYSEFSNNHLKGTIKLDSPKLLFFTIPYDKGWTAKVDGNKVKLFLINMGFMGIILSPGQHTIELDYYPPMLKLGFILTCIGVLIYLLLIIYKFYFIKPNNSPANKVSIF